jgi:L-threonylcarbamoyladenylate synthase
MAAVFASLLDPKLSNALKDGKVGVIPTDTVYGLVCRAEDKDAVEKLYALKDRHKKPGTIMAATIDQLPSIGIKRSYAKAVEQFWPGAVSVVVPSSDPRFAYLRQNLMTIAVRLPDNKELRKLLSETGPLLTTSANSPGKPPASTLQEAEVYFGAKVDFYTQGGDLTGHKPSTVIRVVDDAVEVLRPGAVIIKDNGAA